MIPSDSNYDFPYSPSMNENLDSIAQMLMGTSLFYKLEGARFLLEKIYEKVKGNKALEDALEKLSEIVEHPNDFDPITIQQTLGTLRSID